MGSKLINFFFGNLIIIQVDFKYIFEKKIILLKPSLNPPKLCPFLHYYKNVLCQIILRQPHPAKKKRNVFNIQITMLTLLADRTLSHCKKSNERKKNWTR